MSDIEEELRKLFKKGASLGASFTSILYQHRVSELVDVDNRLLKSYTSMSFGGVGVRVIYNGSIGYASTSDLSKKGLETVLEHAVKGARSLTTGKEAPLHPLEAETADVEVSVKKAPLNISPEEKVSLTLDADKAAWNSDNISRTRTRLGVTVDERLSMSTEGSRVRVVTPLVGMSHSSVAESGGIKEIVADSRSMCSGYEFLENVDWNGFATEISDLALKAVASRTAPPGKYTVVADPDVVGLVLHEALGHATEGDIVAKGGSVLQGRLGTRIASDIVTIIDEGVVEGGYYYPYDDEGVGKRVTTVVEKGVLKGFLTDRRSAKDLNLKPTGNGRAQDFENFPIVRQTNYYMDPGDHTLDELVEDIDFGILVRGRGARGGQVETGMGTFTFGVGPSRIIRNGEVAELVRSVVISGSILDVLKSVDAVGKDFKVRTSIFGGCGKSGQVVKTGIGGPTIRIGQLTVGGR